MTVKFTAHNIRLDDGTETRPEVGHTIESHGWFLAAQRIINAVFPGDKSKIRLADLGCLEGAFAVEFARLGMNVLGVEVRESNFAACEYVKSKINLPKLQFARDDAWNIAKHGTFDVMFCSGLLYHLDKPKAFLKLLSSVTTKLLILHTHFSTPAEPNKKFGLSDMVENEGLQGRWFTEFPTDKEYQNREDLKWASWDNHRSFWIRREELLQTIQDVGFNAVLEQYDWLGADIAEAMTTGYHHTDTRGLFIGIKS